MNIIHICLCNVFTDGWSYQENLLTKFHVKAGHNVTVITSQGINEKGIENTRISKTDYINEDGVKIIRLSIKRGKSVEYKLKQYIGLEEALENESPEVLFIHGCQFLDIVKLSDFVKRKKIRVYIDNHADFSNSATNWLSRYILHGVIWKYCAHKIEPYVEKFYGVLPARMEFLTDVYHLPENKVHLLLMGADDELVDMVNAFGAREKVRQQYNIQPDDFLLVTGGKIDMAKAQTLLLMEAMSKINNEHLKLIIFGSVVPELKEKLLCMCDGDKIQYVGWADNVRSYEYFAAADLAVFPGRHSVYWEQVVGQGVPLLVKDWEGTHHVNLGGNVQFLTRDSVEEIGKKLSDILSNHEMYEKMKTAANSNSKRRFLYSEIARESLNS